ncbi:hypothetical protein HPB52_001678 [Rhipicephalus sanguineus]|uniref:Uncharacterized protein n=1 Tax=Rhipicephalus sanguineus TaxID=34632 RepID=A0A9D4PV10_RHISA|nr:hypothetical protein HPB52_001678 [Rhipicephalus sanguineus]
MGDDIMFWRTTCTWNHEYIAYLMSSHTYDVRSVPQFEQRVTEVWGTILSTTQLGKKRNGIQICVTGIEACRGEGRSESGRCGGSEGRSEQAAPEARQESENARCGDSGHCDG